MVPLYLLGIIAKLLKARPDRTGQTDTFSVALRCPICMSIQPAILLALASHKLRPFLLCVNHCETLKSHSGLVGDHLVEGQFDFAAVCHPVLGSLFYCDPSPASRTTTPAR